jgi:hypothetical protein
VGQAEYFGNGFLFLESNESIELVLFWLANDFSKP